MKIAYVYDAVHPWETGGVQKRVWELGRRLAEEHDVHWYGLKYWDGPDVIEREGVTLHGVGPASDLYVDGRRSIPEALSFTARLVRPLAGAKFDVIDCQEFPYFPCFASKFGALVDDATLLFTWHEVWDEYWHEYLGWKGVFGRGVEYATAHVPDEHVAVSEMTQRDADSLGASGVSLLPNGISIDEIEAAPCADRDIDVLFTGRLIPEKNADLLVRTIEKLRVDRPDVSCLVLGEGPERESIESLVSDRGLEANVDLKPFRDSYEDVLGLMKAADVLALPSQREGFGITALEALAAGTPVATIDHPRNAATELVDDGMTGAVCDATPEAFAAGLRRATAATDAAACRDAAADYEWDRIADRAEKLYREVA